jgi:teichuronic acid biosynthesis protein TuaE
MPLPLKPLIQWTGVFLIASLSLGGLGGSFQPTRLLILCGFFLTVCNGSFRVNKTLAFSYVFYLCFILFGIFSLLWSPNPNQGFFSEILVISLGMLCLPFLGSVDERRVRKTIIDGWYIALVVSLLFASFELVTGVHFQYAEEERDLGGIGEVGLNIPFAAVFFGNINNYSAFLCLCLPFIFCKFEAAATRFTKLMVLLVLILTFIVLLINTSKMSLLVAGLILLSVLIFAFKVHRRKGMFLSIVAGVIVLIPLIPDSYLEMLDLLIRYKFYNAFNSDNESTNERMGMFLAGIDMLQNSYGLGVGAGGYETLFPRSPHFQGIANPHNLLVEIAAQYGIFVFLLFVSWLSVIIYKAINNRSLLPTQRVAVIIGVLIIPLVGVINSKAIGYTYWWVYFASLVVMAYTPIQDVSKSGTKVLTVVK